MPINLTDESRKDIQALSKRYGVSQEVTMRLMFDVMDQLADSYQQRTDFKIRYTDLQYQLNKLKHQ